MDFDIDSHMKEFPHVAWDAADGRFYFWWMVGNMYKRKKGYYGEYPPSYVRRVKSLFPGASPILHLFSGTVEGEERDEYTVDVNPELGADIVCKAEEVDKHFPPGYFSLVLADPPYSKKHAEQYGYGMPNIPKVMKALHKVVRVGGMVVWLSTKPPMYRKDMWRLAGAASLHCGTNRDFRHVAFLEKI